MAGLGNIGPRYSRTLHNAGFCLVDYWATQLGLSWKRKELGTIAELMVEGWHWVFFKPSTYMNESGKAVQRCLQEYRLSVDQLLVVVDDADMAVGTLKLAPLGGSRGHNGLRSVATQLMTTHFKRLRIGVGRPPGTMSLADYVLAPCDEGVWNQIEKRAADAVVSLQEWPHKGFDAVMEAINGEKVRE